MSLDIWVCFFISLKITFEMFDQRDKENCIKCKKPNTGKQNNSQGNQCRLYLHFHLNVSILIKRITLAIKT